MLTLDPPLNKAPSIRFFTTCTKIITMWGSIAIDTTWEGGTWRWVGWLLGDILKTTYCFKLRAKCMSWPRVRVCLLLSNCWSILWNASYFLTFIPLSKKLVLIFGGLDDSRIGGWLLGTAFTMDSGACICWIIDSKVFAITPPFRNHS